MNDKLKQFSIIILSLCIFMTTEIFTKTTVFSGTTNRILPMLKEIGNALDENRWEIGELISSTTTITNPGVYILTNDIEVNSGIVIDANNVVLDLNGYMVYDNSGTTTGITINNGHSNIYIKNGSVNGKADTSTACGILINSNASLVQIEDVRVLEWYTGIKLDGLSTGTVSECKITNCMLVTNTKGIVVNYGEKNIFSLCSAYNCAEAGFELNNSELNLFEECSVLEIGNGNPTSNAIGFSSTDGCGNLFKECTVNGVYKSDSNFGYNPTGFLLKDSEARTKICNSIINRAICTGCATSYGIHLDFKINDNALDQSLYTGNYAIDSSEILIVDWSPETKFIAIGGKDNKVRIFAFNGSTLTHVDEKTFSADVNALAWSPDGTYLAVGTDSSGSDEFFVYLFDSSPLDPSSTLTLLDSKPVGDHVHSLAWSPNSRFIALGVDRSTDYEIQVWGFDGTNLSSSEIYKVNRVNDVKSVAFSPDGKHLAAVHSNQLEIFSFDPTVGLMIDQEDLGGCYMDSLECVDWSPLICDSKYFLAVGGNRYDNITTQVFSFENRVLTCIANTDHGAKVNDVKWSPNGKHLLTGGVASSGISLRIYDFDASATASKLILSKSGAHCSDPVNSLDWEASGRYIVAVGCDTGDDTCILEVSTCPRRCIIESNEITDAQIGIEGSSGSNLITKNIGYYNKICFSSGVFNTFIEGLNENPTNIDNICLPPFYYAIFIPEENGDCGCHHDD